ncbi:hypothetical protein HEM55_021470 [Escherichia coli]|uniref:hypothetical protein n=1 Tax=Escherichia coli TaxID=562 RepID=UPI0017EAA8A2|nr:hypothetical protein [Escherichia coli]MBB7505026.1 hypothetical protein [Escherichia coli]MBN6416928.1 hypothetical protein [Escherichia coli]
MAKFKALLKVVAVFSFFVSCVLHSEQVENKNNFDVSVDDYANELKEFQEIQYANHRLKLELQNKKLKDELGVSAEDEFRLISVSCTQNKFIAKIYHKRSGVRNVSVGDYFAGYKVINIAMSSILLEDNSNTDKKINIPLM